MEATRIEPGSRFWPNGLDDLMGEAPRAITVLGNAELLARQAVVVTGTPMATARGRALSSEYGQELGATDIVVAGDIANPIGPAAAMDSVRAGGDGVILARLPFDEHHELHRSWMDAVARRDGAVVILADGDGPFPADRYESVLAAYSTVVFVPESDGDPRGQDVAIAALDLGSGVAVAKPHGRDIPAYAGTVQLLDMPHITRVESSRDVAGMIGPATGMNTQLQQELEHLEFSSRMAELRQAGRLDAATEQMLSDMADESVDLREFQARLRFGGPRRWTRPSIETSPRRRRRQSGNVQTAGRKPKRTRERTVSTATTQWFTSSSLDSIKVVSWLTAYISSRTGTTL